VAEEKKEKSPQELGEAVGQKIDELFGGLFGDDAAPVMDDGAETGGLGAEPQPPEQPPEPPGDHITPPPPPAPPPQPAAAQPTAGRSAPARAPAMHADESENREFEELLHRIEALVLSLDWELKPETIRDLGPAFREVERYFPGAEHAQSILSMNRRVVQRFSSPDAVPHRYLVRLLKDSVQALKQIHSSDHGKLEDNGLLTRISESYKEIMAAGPPAGDEEPAGAPASSSEAQYDNLVKDFGGAVHSLEEVSQRLARILAVLRQGGEMSREEISRRLGTLEQLLADRVGQLDTMQKRLTTISPGASGSTENGSGRLPGQMPDGVLMLVCDGVAVGVPSSVILSLHPLPKEKAQQLLNMTNIILGGKQVQRIALKQTKDAKKKPATPSWLIHVTLKSKEFFLLAERALGFRKTPEGADLARQRRIKISGSNFTLINEKVFG
jgi:hypothetical protein